MAQGKRILVNYETVLTVFSGTVETGSLFLPQKISSVAIVGDRNIVLAEEIRTAKIVGR